jgi:signal transduction histidine kinase/ActR/RegA family two-component response regulator
MPLASAPQSPWVRGVITFLIYVAAGLASVALAPTGEGVSQMYLAAGFGLALVLGWGRWMAIPVGIGSALVSLLATLWFKHPHLSAPLLAGCAAAGLGSGLQAWAAARWTQGRDPQRPMPLERARDIGLFLLVAGPLACTISAMISMTALVLLGLKPHTDWLRSMGNWWAGDTLGVLIGTPIMLTLVGRPVRLWQQRRWVVGIPLLVSALLLGLGIQQIQRWENERESAEFRQQAEATANGVRLRLTGYLDAVESMRGLYDASQSVERAEFKRASQHWLTHLHGIKAMGWNERVSLDQLDAFEHEQRSEGLANYRVFSLPDRSRPKSTEIVALRFIEPVQGNEQAFGFNVLSRDTAAQTYLKAVREDGAVASPGFALIQESNQQLGVVIYRPVYREPSATPENRLRSVKGVVFLALRMEDALTAILKDAPAFIHACLMDTTRQPAQFLSGDPLCRQGLTPLPPLKHAVILPFAQREWTLQLWAVDTVPLVGGRSTTWLFAVGGVAFAAALGALLLVVTGANDRLTAAIDEAREQRQAAEAANQAKSDFLSRMSHELRTPLNAMLGFAQVMAMDRQHVIDSTQHSRLDQIQQAGWHLLDMIDDVLDLSRIDTGTLRLHTEPLALSAVLEATHHLVRDVALKYGITLSVDGTLPALWGVQADDTRLRQILTNLLTNAVKYNRPGGSVHVQSTLIRGPGLSPMINIVVTDTGLGMSEDQLTQLFQPFNRLGRERHAPDGTGIGLVISRHLALLMGGQLEVVSVEDSGSTFTLSLPATPLLPEVVINNTQTESTLAPAMTGTPQTRHVLYVEDNDANTALVKAALESRTWIQLSVASTIEAGLASLHDRLRGPLPQLILLDVHLPDASGLDFLKLVKANPETQHIPVVMISADAMPEQIDACLRAGASCYLTKPLQISALLAQVDDLLA